MKIQNKGAEAFMRAPTHSVVLLYGPDRGLVAERARALAATVVEDLHDPFRVSEMEAEALRAAPFRLAEEAQSLCLLGGRRLVWVTQAGDQVRPAVEMMLANGAPEAFVIIEADDLSGGSTLRKLAERHEQVAVVACYRESAGDLRSTVRGYFRERGLRIDDQALDYLQQRLGDDRGVTMQELEKLALYKGEDASPLTLDEARQAMGDNSAAGLDDLFYALCGGESARMLALTDRFLGEGMNTVALLRMLMRAVTDLLRQRIQVEQGADVDAVLSARRSLHFSVRDRHRQALSSLTAARLTGWLAALQQAELACKSTGMPDTLVCRQVLAALSPARPEKRAAPRAPAARRPFAQNRPST